MLCRIADLLVEVSAAGGMSPRCRSYEDQSASTPDIVITDKSYVPDNWPALSYEDMCYMESGANFYGHLLSHGGMMLHASAVALGGRAFLFSGPCGRGKSTHTRLWQQEFGANAVVFNDDKPALRLIDGRWFAYGTPWCGKDGINSNIKVPLSGVCFLERGSSNLIRRLSASEASSRIVGQTMRRFGRVESLDLMLGLVDKLVRDIPVYELMCNISAEAAHLSRRVMEADAEEAGL